MGSSDDQSQSKPRSRVPPLRQASSSEEGAEEGEDVDLEEEKASDDSSEDSPPIRRGGRAKRQKSLRYSHKAIWKRKGKGPAR